MEIHGLIAWIAIGVIAGWLAGLLVQGRGFGLLLDTLLGIAGAFLGGWLASLFGLAGGGFTVSIIMAVIGAVIVLVLIRLVRKTTSE